MNEITNNVMAPAIIIALISVIIQGLKILIDLIIQMVNKKNSDRQNNLAFLTILNSFIDSSSLDEGEKIAAKVSFIKQYSSDDLPENIRNLFE